MRSAEDHKVDTIYKEFKNNQKGNAENLQETYVSNSKKGLSLHTTKCAVLRLLGIEISTEEIKNMLLEYCHWQPVGVGIELDEFKLLIAHLSRPMEERLINDFLVFDSKGKGWISEEDFARVVTIVFVSHSFE